LIVGRARFKRRQALIASATPAADPKAVERTWQRRIAPGRRPGSLNRRTIELRALMASLAGDISYQRKLREAFVKRRLHPSTEIKIWEYSIGKPKEQIEMSATVSMDDRIAAERELFARLSIEEMEEVAAESQALVDKVMAMAKANALTPDDVASRRASVEDGESSDAPNPTGTGTDVDPFGDGDAPLNRDGD
jgi:hypothetical protein